MEEIYGAKGDLRNDKNALILTLSLTSTLLLSETWVGLSIYVGLIFKVWYSYRFSQ